MDMAITTYSAVKQHDGQPSNSVLALPIELLEHILLFCHPRDVSRFSRTCRFSGDFVHRSVDSYFWRQLFTSFFDDPRHGIRPFFADPSSYDWKGELRRLFLSPGFPTTLPASHNVEWLGNILRSSHLLDVSFSKREAKFGDRLKAYMALSLKDEDDWDDLLDSPDMRTKSRCLVYDLRNYCAENSWGPYHFDGTINWTHVNCIINVVVFNIREQPSVYQAMPPVGLQAIRPYSAPGDYSGPDWAGVEGTWRRYVCFMDYRDLFAFNFSGAHDGPRDPSFFDDRTFREATRLMDINLHLIPQEQMRVKFPQGDPPTRAHPQYETLYFSGISRGASAGHEAIVQGFVYMGEDYHPRWRLTSLHDGHPQWRCQFCHCLRTHRLNRSILALKASRSVMWAARLGLLGTGLRFTTRTVIQLAPSGFGKLVRAPPPLVQTIPMPYYFDLYASEFLISHLVQIYIVSYKLCVHSNFVHTNLFFNFRLQRFNVWDRSNRNDARCINLKQDENHDEIDNYSKRTVG
ncbi:F-box domain-containing protein [Mycena sanguinolenta]|uniref:F-box domain-containing protein n=1 Tax=Mycena sanguinolenta TaxID=230812 RepID=A0A8H7D0F8_9AGAR|nr:F-box domain-containing protein [Mycena sanguinolenta]